MRNMPSFFKIEKENTSKTRLIGNLKIYSEKTGRNVVIYASNFLNNDSEENYINSFDKNGFMKVMTNLNKSKELDLILHTPGGAISETESIIDYLQVQFNQNIRAIIPQMAMSGGTMIACSCNEIYMGNQSSLGPVDPQILDMSAKSVVKEHELAKKEIMEQPETIPYWTTLLDKYPANFVFECETLIEWSENILEKALKYSKTKNINKLKKFLITSESIKEHSQNFSAIQCKEMGLPIKFLENEKNLNKLILSIHKEYLNYFNENNARKIFVNQKGIFISVYSDK